MPFIARATYKERKARAYMYHSESAPLNSAFKNISEVMHHVDYILHETGSRRVDFRIPIVWANESEKVVEVFGYSGLGNSLYNEEWQMQNPEVHSWVFVDGSEIPERRQIACEESLMVLGAEAQYRRTTKSFSYYMSDWPLFDNSEISSGKLPIIPLEYLPGRFTGAGVLLSSVQPMNVIANQLKELGLEI